MFQLSSSGLFVKFFNGKLFLRDRCDHLDGILALYSNLMVKIGWSIPLSSEIYSISSVWRRLLFDPGLDLILVEISLSLVHNSCPLSYSLKNLGCSLGEVFKRNPSLMTRDVLNSSTRTLLGCVEHALDDPLMFSVSLCLGLFSQL